MTAAASRRLGALGAALCPWPTHSTADAACAAATGAGRAAVLLAVPPAEPLRRVSEQEIREYDASGVVCLRGIFPPEWVELMRPGLPCSLSFKSTPPCQASPTDHPPPPPGPPLPAAVDEAMADPGPFAEEYTPTTSPGRFFGDLDVWRRHATFRRFALESCAARVAAAVMRSERCTFFYDQLLVKEPGTAERTTWHQARRPPLPLPPFV